MKNIQFSVVRSLFLTLFLGVFVPSQAQCVPGLGTASGFVIYTAGGAVANTAISTINGDIGTNLGAITGFTTAVVTGSFHNGDALTQTAVQDLSTAYGAFQNLTPTVTNHAPVFGNGETITAGVYSIASAVAISGTLTLDGQNNPNAKFIFQIGGALNSSAGTKIVLTNGATPNNVYWVVLNACGLGANTTFYGTVMAGAAIASGDNCQIVGKLLSVAGAIAVNNSILSNNGSSMFYADADHDGYGNPAVSSCFYVAGYVNNDKDCSDNNAAINPGAVEIWGNYIDENCDGIIFRPQEQCLPSVGMASEFTLFTGAGAITHSATVSNITGNIGTNLGVISGFELSHVTGTFINANLITQTAKQDLISAYTMFQNLAPTVTDHAPAFGSETLTAGIYSIGGAGSIAGVLVLDGQNNCENKFVFKFGGAFTTGAGCSVVLINGALPKNIYWIANGAAGLAANVVFNGTIINNAALSVGLGVTLNGKLLTTTGAITVLGSNLTNSGPIQNTFYSDNDSDGYGDASISVLESNCSLPGYTLDGNDCDDTNSSTHPYAIEIYGNAIDDNCNGIVDTDASPCLPASVSIAATATTICSGTSVTFTATSINGGTSPSYQWKVNAITVSGQTASTFTSTTLANSNVVTAIVLRTSGPCLPGSPATSNTVAMTVNPNLPASVSIAATATTICSGTSVTFTATATNGGTAPAYQWKVNGVNAGTNSATFTTTTLANTDAVTVILTSNATPCLIGSPATSNSITMTVNPNLPASVSISSTATTICSGTSVTFTATPTNGGATPTYQWKNGALIIIGATNATYTSTTLTNNNSISVVMISNASPCLTGSPATSNSINMTVNLLPIALILSNNSPICPGTVASFVLSGTSSATVRYTINGETTLTTILTDGTNIITVPNASVLQNLNLVSVTSNGCTSTLGTSSVVGFESTTYNGTSWSNGLPNSTKSAIFTGNYTVTTNLYACTLQVSNNAVVIVNNGFNLYLNGAITVAPTATLLFNSNTNLIQTDESAVNTGNIVVKRNSATIIRLDHTLWSSPVVGQNIFGFSPATLTNRFYTYDTPTNTYTNTTLNSTSEFMPGKGIAIRAPNNQSGTVPAEWTGTFTGVPNNGNISIPLATNATNGSNCNLIGNPYPSEIDAQAFLDYNASTIEGTIYYYQHTLPMNAAGIFPEGTNYATLNDTGGTPATQFNNIPNFPYVAAIPGETVQVGQGFIVKAIASGNVTFTNSMRIVGNGSSHFNKTTVPREKNRLWLNLLSNTGADINQILVGYISGATQAVDSKFDGLSFGNKGSYIYSTIAGGNYVVQGRSLPFQATDEVSLGFKCTTAGTYTIKLTDRDGLFLSNQDIFIRDNLTGVDTNIKLAPYTFTSDIGVFDSRFKIVYTQALGIPSTDFTPNSVIVYKNTDWFHVSTKGITMKDILVYDISGRLIYKLSDINATTAVLRGLPQTNEVLFLKITSEDNVTVTVKAIGY